MRRRRPERERREKRENRRLMLKKLHAALLRSFRGHHGKKIVCARGMPGVSRTLGKANSYLDQIQPGSGTAPPR